MLILLILPDSLFKSQISSLCRISFAEGLVVAVACHPRDFMRDIEMEALARVSALHHVLDWT